MEDRIEKHELSDSIYMSGHGLDRKESDDIAEQLYTEGYRKQSECDLVEVANWAGSIEYKCTACKEGFFHAKYYQYCPFCGAKRKGGAE